MEDTTRFTNAYQGTPSQIIVKISEEIAALLSGSTIGATGVTAIALVHVAACIIRSAELSSVNGKMPSFKSMLGTLTHGTTGTSWTPDELEAFDKDFSEVVFSLGGSKLSDANGSKVGPTPFMAPLNPNITH